MGCPWGRGEILEEETPCNSGQFPERNSDVICQVEICQPLEERFSPEGDDLGNAPGLPKHNNQNENQARLFLDGFNIKTKMAEKRNSCIYSLLH